MAGGKMPAFFSCKVSSIQQVHRHTTSLPHRQEQHTHTPITCNLNFTTSSSRKNRAEPWLAGARVRRRKGVKISLLRSPLTSALVYTNGNQINPDMALDVVFPLRPSRAHAKVGLLGWMEFSFFFSESCG